MNWTPLEAEASAEPASCHRFGKSILTTVAKTQEVLSQLLDPFLGPWTRFSSWRTACPCSSVLASVEHDAKVNTGAVALVTWHLIVS